MRHALLLAGLTLLALVPPAAAEDTCSGAAGLAVCQGERRLERPVQVDAGSGPVCIRYDSGNARCVGVNHEWLDGDVKLVRAGYGVVCVVTQAGDVDCEGWNTALVRDFFGQNVVDIDFGYNHGCLLRAAGTVECWGSNYYGERHPYFGADAVALAAGPYHTCVLAATQIVHCGGANWYSQAPAVMGVDGAVGLATSHYTTCILRATGTTFCWGASYVRPPAAGLSSLVGGWYDLCWVRDTGSAECAWWGTIVGHSLAVSAGDGEVCTLHDGYANCRNRGRFDPVGDPRPWRHVGVSTTERGTPVVAPQRAQTPEIRAPAPCTLPACTTPTKVNDVTVDSGPVAPVVTPTLPADRTCVPPILPLLCVPSGFVGPITVFPGHPGVDETVVGPTLPAACALVGCPGSTKLLDSQDRSTPGVPAQGLTPAAGVGFERTDPKVDAGLDFSREIPPFPLFGLEFCPEGCPQPVSPSADFAAETHVQVGTTEDRRRVDV